MKSIRNITTAAVATAGLALLAAPASAATAAPASPAAPATRAPSCIHTSTSTGIVTKKFTATNYCAHTYRVRFILARHTDSDCYTLAPKHSVSIKVARTAALSELRLC